MKGLEGRDNGERSVSLYATVTDIKTDKHRTSEGG